MRSAPGRRARRSLQRGGDHGDDDVDDAGRRLARRVVLPVLQRGRGIGKSLVRACEAAMVAKGLTTIYTHTKVDNEGAQALFENGGYTVGLCTLNQVDP